jgi:4-oxalocrotonate tautomerase family enzyme
LTNSELICILEIAGLFSVTYQRRKMPLIEIYMQEGSVDKAGKQRIIKGVTDAIAEAQGMDEYSRSFIWVRIEEVPAGSFGVGGRVIDWGERQEMIRQRQMASEQGT